MIESEKYEQLISVISQDLTNDTRLRDTGIKQYGKKNLWEGASGFLHQIDASIHNDTDVLLIECKCWGKVVRSIEVLALLGRLVDIIGNPKNRALNIRGAIVTTEGWQRGVEKLVRHYSEICSIFVAKEDEGIKRMIHTHFIRPVSILSGAEQD
jgi:hypothetical protein